jgi:hypothetical protein
MHLLVCPLYGIRQDEVYNSCNTEENKHYAKKVYNNLACNSEQTSTMYHPEVLEKSHFGFISFWSSEFDSFESLSIVIGFVEC